jgi:hypothetical protein
MKENKIREEMISGDDLLSDGYTEDTFGNTIIPTAQYMMRIMEDKDWVVFTTVSNWNGLHLFDIGNQVVDIGGLKEWYQNEIKSRPNFTSEQCITKIQEVIKHRETEEDYEMAAYLSNELKIF